MESGRLEIAPASLPVKLVKRGPGLVAEPIGPVEPLTNATVQRVREQIRREREDRLL